MTDAESLLDYGAVREGGRYHLELERRDGEWVPAPTPRMPYHHASRLVFTNVGLLTSATAARLRAELVVDAIHIQQVHGQQSWRAEYFATLLSVTPVE